METHWEARVRAKTLVQASDAIAADYTASMTALGEVPNVTTADQATGAHDAAGLLAVVLGLDASATNLEVAASGYDNGQEGALHEAGITVTVRKLLA